jgi:hypothetical protein
VEGYITKTHDGSGYRYSTNDPAFYIKFN